MMRHRFGHARRELEPADHPFFASVGERTKQRDESADVALLRAPLELARAEALDEPPSERDIRRRSVPGRERSRHGSFVARLHRRPSARFTGERRWWRFWRSRAERPAIRTDV